MQGAQLAQQFDAVRRRLRRLRVLAIDADRERAIRFQHDLDIVVGRLRAALCIRQIDHARIVRRRHHHEDDQEHQHHVDVGHDVDLGLEFAAAATAHAAGKGRRHQYGSRLTRLALQDVRKFFDEALEADRKAVDIVRKTIVSHHRWNRREQADGGRDQRFGDAGRHCRQRRLLHVAVTRAKKELIISAVQREDDEPSTYFEEISTHVLGEWSTDPVMSVVPRPITPAALVATLRRELYGEKREIAAQILSRLNTESLSEADVDSWAGVTPISSIAPIIAPDALVPVSPSSAESFTECGVKWFLERSGGQNGDSVAQVLGSAIHAFAELMERDETLTEADLVAKLQASWKLIDPETGWVSSSQMDRAIEMIHRFVLYHTSRTNKIVGVEARFNVVVGRAQIPTAHGRHMWMTRV